MVRLLLWFAVNAFALGQDFQVVPSTKQGDLLQLAGPDHAATAIFLGRVVPLYPGTTVTRVAGLMPVPVLTKPGSYQLRWLDTKGKAVYEQTVQVRSAHFPVQNVVLTKGLAGLKSTDDEQSQVSRFFKSDSPQRSWTLPIEAPLQSCLTSFFGVRRAHNGRLTGDFHGGLDQRGATGTPIHAVAAGTVTLTGQFALHGGTVGIDHGQGLKSMYLHMSEITVRSGAKLAKGDVIGLIGSTGRSTGSHLHWALYAFGEPVNPLQWVRLQPCPAKAVKRRRA